MEETCNKLRKIRFADNLNLVQSCMRSLLLLVFLIGILPVNAQKTWHIGGSYSFGGAWNLHTSNHKIARPSDVSSLGLIAYLENDGKSMGFQAGMYMKWNDVRNQLKDNYYLDNSFSSLELKLQSILPLGQKTAIGFGIAPRLVMRNKFSIVYASSANGSHLESELEIPDTMADLNELNSSLLLSFQYKLHKRWQFALYAEGDIQPVYAENVVFENYDSSAENEPAVEINSFLTSLSGSIIFWVK